MQLPLWTLAAALALTALPAMAKDDVPTRVGDCVDTSIEEITSRLEGVPDSGDVVIYANGLVGVSYDTIPGLRKSRVGDPVALCLTYLPEDCPAGDDRGKIYAATNERNDAEWELPDAAHMCGGA